MSESYDNNGQYSRHSILRYEKIFGEGFVSTGGLPIVERFCDQLTLPKHPKVLDIGSGLGGAAFHIAKRFQAEVLGIDLSDMMLAIASERVQENQQTSVSFQKGNILTMSFPNEHFDLVWSRDALLHIPEKDQLFAKAYDWMKPNGQILISDYARSKNPKTKAFLDYVETSGYHLLDVETYGKWLEQAGFVDVIAEDWTPLFIETLQAEMKMLQTDRSIFLQDFSQEDLDYLMSRWESKIGYCRAGDMRVGMWRGTKIA